jgi:hypothetical protein
LRRRRISETRYKSLKKVTGDGREDIEAV